MSAIIGTDFPYIFSDTGHQSINLFRGPLNKKNIIPLKFIFSEPDKYGSLLDARPATGESDLGVDPLGLQHDQRPFIISQIMLHMITKTCKSKYKHTCTTPRSRCQRPMLAESISWRSVTDLARMVERPDVTSVIVDMNGSMGYFQLLMGLAPSLGSKIKASGMPITIMAGVQAEAEAGTLRVPGR